MTAALLRLLNIFAFMLALAACSSPSLPAESSLPDLVVDHARSSLAPPLCLGTHSRPGALVYVSNRGGADAGSFVVTVNGVEQAVTDGLPGGEHRELWFDAAAPWTEIRVSVDPDAQVTEGNETNNDYVTMVATLTPPPPCTPTPGNE